MPRKDAILQGEIALGALEGRFWLPGSSVCIGGRWSVFEDVWVHGEDALASDTSCPRYEVLAFLRKY